VAWLPFIFGDMLRRGTTRFARELVRASLMDTMPARRIDAAGHYPALRW